MDFSTPGFPVHNHSQSLLKLMSIELVMPSNHFTLCHPLLLLTSIFPSIRVFSNESVLCIRWPKYWTSSFNINPSNEYSRLIPFSPEGNGLFGSPCSPRDSQESSPTPQFKSISSSVLSFLYSPTLTSIYDYWKSHSFMTFIFKVMSLLFNILSRMAIALLPRSNNSDLGQLEMVKSKIMLKSGVDQKLGIRTHF